MSSFPFPLFFLSLLFVERYCDLDIRKSTLKLDQYEVLMLLNLKYSRSLLNQVITFFFIFIYTSTILLKGEEAKRSSSRVVKDGADRTVLHDRVFS